MSVQWFPGHMNKAKKAIGELVSKMDVIIELLDARAPFSSCNPLLQSMIKHKKIIKLLNKADLADEQITKKWINFFVQRIGAIALQGYKDSKQQRQQLINLCKKLAPTHNSFEKPLRVMVIGIPNVGKSTLINKMIGKKSALTGDIPAVTRSNQCFTICDNFLIYDTPGMTWQKINHEQVGNNLAICNSIGKNALDEELLVLYLIGYLKQFYANHLSSRYKLEPRTLHMTSIELLNVIARKRGCLLNRELVDLQKTSELILKDFREGRIGKITLETPILWDRWINQTEQQK